MTRVWIYCLWPTLIIAMDVQEFEKTDTYTITVNRRTSAPAPLDLKDIEPQDGALSNRALFCILGHDSPLIRKECGHVIEKKMIEAGIQQDELEKSVNFQESGVVMSESEDMRKFRTLVAQSFEETIDKKDKQLRSERYKFYTALVVLAGTVVTSAVTLATLLHK